MTELEEKLRDALTATADLVTNASLRRGQLVGPLEPVRTAVERRVRHRRLVPALVVTTALLVAAGAFSLSRVFSGDGSSSASAGAAITALPASPATSPAPYFVTAMMGGSDLDDPYQELTVRNAVTGAVTAVVPSSKDLNWSTVAATADPWTFFVYADSPWGRSASQIYRLTITTAGRVKSLLPVESLKGTVPSQFTVSPDGEVLAIDNSSADGGSLSAGITLVNVRDGGRRVLLADQIGTTGPFSWSADGRHLAFRLSLRGSELAMSSSQNGVWILDTGLPGADLLANSRQAIVEQDGAFFAEFGPYQWILSADSRRLYYPDGALNSAHSVMTKRIIERDVLTGRQLRVLLELHHRFSTGMGWGSDGPLALDPSGRWLLVSDAGADYYRIDLVSGKVSRLPAVVNRGHPNFLAW